MVTLQKDYTIQRYVGLSTDTKPTAGSGDLFLEMDTSKVFMYDESGTSWVEVSVAW